MTLSTFIPLLSIVTLGAVAVVALLSRRQTLKRKDDPDAPKSALAADGPSHGSSK